MTTQARNVTALLLVLAAPLAAAQDFGAPEVRSEPLGDGLHVVFGPGAGNMLVSIGDSGVLLVDDGVPDIVDAYRAEIAELGGGAIDIAVNTHWHFDHADGNKVLGPDGVRLVAHENSRRMMMQDNVINLVSQTFDQPAYEPAAWPEFTYDSTMRLHFNGERIDLMHFGPAHTEGDAVAYLPEQRVVAVGDLVEDALPWVDDDSDPVGWADALDRIAELDADVILPAHGPVLRDRVLLDRHRAFFRAVVEDMQTARSGGAGMEEAVASLDPAAVPHPRLAEAPAEDDAWVQYVRRVATRAYQVLSDGR